MNLSIQISFLLIQVIKGYIPGGNIQINLQVLYFIQFFPSFPNFDEYIGDDLFGGFFHVYDGKTKPVETDKIMPVQVFEGMLIG